MFGNLGQLAGMMKNFQNIKANIESMKTQLAESVYPAKSSCGLVEVLVGGDFSVRKIVISQSLLDTADSVLVGDAVTDALNNAFKLVKTAAAEKLKEVTGGLDIPGLV